MKEKFSKENLFFEGTLFDQSLCPSNVLYYQRDEVFNFSQFLFWHFTILKSTFIKQIASLGLKSYYNWCICELDSHFNENQKWFQCWDNFLADSSHLNCAHWGLSLTIFKIGLDLAEAGSLSQNKLVLTKRKPIFFYFCRGMEWRTCWTSYSEKNFLNFLNTFNLQEREREFRISIKMFPYQRLTAENFQLWFFFLPP